MRSDRGIARPRSAGNPEGISSAQRSLDPVFWVPNEQEAHLLWYLETYGERTANDLAMRCAYSHRGVLLRLYDLRRAGRVMITGRLNRGGNAYLWAVTPS